MAWIQNMGLLLDMGAGPPIEGKGLNSEESPPLSKKNWQNSHTDCDWDEASEIDKNWIFKRSASGSNFELAEGLFHPMAKICRP